VKPTRIPPYFSEVYRIAGEAVRNAFRHAQAQRALRRGKPVVLTTMEFKTLKFLLQNARRVISRDELLNEVWGYPCTRTVDNHILRLRRKLERDPSRPIHFHTVHGARYKFSP
jgi:DNA-binding response OmpR family regulator